MSQTRSRIYEAFSIYIFLKASTVDRALLSHLPPFRFHAVLYWHRSFKMNIIVFAIKSHEIFSWNIVVFLLFFRRSSS